MFNFWWSAEQSEQKTSTKTQKNKKGTVSHQRIKCLFFNYVQLLMIGRAFWAKNVDQNTKKWKKPPKSSKNKIFVCQLHSTSDDWLSNLTKTQKNEKGPLSHRKIKCSFLDYIQLLIIGWAIRAKNVDQNTKKPKRPPKSSKNKMFVFRLRSTSDDQPSNLSKKHWPKHKNMKKAP